MKDLKKMTLKELEEEISKKSTEAINGIRKQPVLSKEQFKKKMGMLKGQLKEIKGQLRGLSKKMKATKGGKK